MRWHVRILGLAALFAAAGLLVAADQPNASEVKKELKATAGTWRIVALERNGEKVSTGELKGRTITTTPDGHFTIRQGGKTVAKGTLKLDPSKEPKTIDATYQQNDDHPDLEGKTVHGIYERERDEFKVCYARPGQDRPKDFSAKEGSGQVCITYERSKSKSK